MGETLTHNQPQRCCHFHCHGLNTGVVVSLSVFCNYPAAQLSSGQKAGVLMDSYCNLEIAPHPHPPLPSDLNLPRAQTADLTHRQSNTVVYQTG